MVRYAAIWIALTIIGLQSTTVFGDETQKPTTNSKVTKPGKHDWLIKHPVILRLLKLTNAERARYGMPPAKLNTKMCLAAQNHAMWMAKNNAFWHSNLPWAEIIQYSARSADEAVNVWIYSPAHHSLMLSGTEAGFGYMVINGRTYWVGLFR